MKAHSINCFSLIAVISLIGCSGRESGPPAEAAQVKVYAVNYPLAYFAERIGGGAVEVVLPEIEGDPAFWQPEPDDLTGFQGAGKILVNGAGYAKWLDYVSLPQSKLVHTSSAFKNQYIEISGAPMHSHGDGEAHAHGELAFTTWLDPMLAIEQAAAIDAALALPESGFEALKSDLLALDQSLAAAFTRLSGQALIGSHPVYQYLQRRYDLNLRSLHWEPDMMPDEAMWQELQALRRTHPSKILLWESEPLAGIKARLDAMGIQSVVFDPCGNRPEQGDYLAVMRANVARIESNQLD